MSLFSKKKKNKIPRKSWQRKSTKAYPGVPGKAKSQKRGSFSRALFWVLLFVFFGICVYLLLFSTFLDIDKISIEGNQDISTADIAKEVAKSIEGKYWGYMPRKNFFLVNRKSIDAAVNGNFSRLEVASIGKKFPDTLFLKVIEHKAELVWCSAGVCYFADKNGLIYGGTTGTEEEMRAGNFLVVVDDSARPVEIGTTKISPEFIQYIEAASAMIRDDLKIGVSESYHTPGMASQEISMITSEGWILKMSSEYTVDEAKKIIQTLFDKDLNVEQRKILEYLDLRIRNKIYYKIKPEEEEDRQSERIIDRIQDQLPKR